MKKLFISLLMALFCISAGARPIYYVVVASTYSYKEAKKMEAPIEVDDYYASAEDLWTLCVVKAEYKGRTLYRMVVGAFYSKAEAVKDAKCYKSESGKPLAWVWESDDRAQCIRPGEHTFYSTEPELCYTKTHHSCRPTCLSRFRDTLFWEQ